MAGNRKMGNGVRFPAKKEKPLLLIFAAVFCFIVIIVSFIPMTRSIEDDTYIKHLESRVAELEKRLEGVDLNPETMRRLKIQSSKMDSYINNYSRLDASVNLKTNLLATRMDKMQRQVDGVKRRVIPKRYTKKSGVNVASVKKQKYHKVKKGDTFYSISRKYGITLKRLKSINGFTEKTTIYPGQDVKVE